jgi:hypothetical protein
MNVIANITNATIGYSSGSVVDEVPFELQNAGPFPTLVNETFWVSVFAPFIVAVQFTIQFGGEEMGIVKLTEPLPNAPERVPFSMYEELA